MKYYKNKIKWCPLCSQGWGEIVKDKNTKKLFLCCSECETEWTNPEKIEVNEGTTDMFGFIEEPTIEEIEKIGWDRYIIK